MIKKEKINIVKYEVKITLFLTKCTTYILLFQWIKTLKKNIKILIESNLKSELITTSVNGN